MRKLKIGIKTQLIVLVTFASLFSLLILAAVCGAYFSTNLSDLRAERLEVISQLKASQVTQALYYLMYQVYWVTTRDAVTNPLSSYRAGNNSNAVFQLAQSTLDQFLTSSESFAAARLYNLDLEVVAESFNNGTIVSTPSLDYLYPLQQNLTVPPAVNQLENLVNSYFLTGPVSNNSDSDSSYFIGITYAIFANTSIILTTPSIAGYLSVITSANNIQRAVSQTETFSLLGAASDYKVVAVEPVYDSGTNFDDTGDEDELVGFQAIFPVNGSSLDSNRVYNVNESSAVREALTGDFGSSTKEKNIDGETVAIGYSALMINNNKNWTIMVEQDRSTFNAPVSKFTKIIIGVSIGVGFFVCLITFPMAVFFIRPITNLKNATEAITRSKREQEKRGRFQFDNVDTGTPPPSYYSTLIRRFNPKDNKEEQEKLLNEKESDNPTDKASNQKSKRNSVLSAGTGGSNSVYSTGIRLPTRIPNSKRFFKDELTELTQAFNIMREELEKQYTHLEDRVKLRTKELEASKIEAEAANEAKTVFIANISHELRTPLNGILGMTTIAMEEEDSSKIKDSLTLINRSGELLLHILTELLTYSKNTLNRSKLEKSSFQILEIAYQVQSIFSKLASDQRVFFKILLKPNSLRNLILHGDSNRIIQVVMNLVSNSLKFTPVDGKVDVTFRLLGEYDHQRSEEEEFSDVYVLGHNSPANNFNHHNENHGIQSPYDGKKPIQPPSDGDNGSISSGERAMFNDNDNTSIVTLSTDQYNEAIFESQFRSSAKPLPGVPDISLSDKSSSTSGDAHDNRSSSDTQDSEPPAVPPKEGRKSSLLPPPNMRDKQGSTVSATTETGTTKRPSVSSASASLNSNELVKNNKVYKIKKFYKPKTWVLQIEVTDTGPGIEPALQEKVFEPFIQGDQTLSRSYGGTGLGLSICRQLAKMMNGTMTLKSTLGIGSTFTFTVPLPQVGEILVPDDEMVEFCEDEFNPNSRMNRKVAFTFNKDEIIHEAGESEDAVNTEFHDSYESASANDSGNATPVLPAGFPQPLSTSSPEDFTTSPRKDKGSSNPQFRLERPSPLSRNPSSDGNHSDHKRKGYFEKPHLATRSSTGTANLSVSTSEKLDSHLLLDDLRHLKILVAEDNLVNQEVIKRMLSLEGFTNITMASNGAEAVDNVKQSIASNEVFDLIFMDVQMPKIDGLLATKMIRNNLQYQRPIIALTAFADESNAKECLNSGMSGFLAKPIRRTNLRKIITEFWPVLLKETVTTPQTHQSEEKRLGYDSSNGSQYHSAEETP